MVNVAQIKQWSWLIGLSIAVVVIVGIAYNVTPNAQPLDGVGTLASLLLTVFLVYIYSQQNIILKNQEQILEEQRETQEAADVSPRLQINEPNYSKKDISIKLINNGAGPAYDVYITTDTTISNISGFKGGVWKKNLSNYVPEGDSESGTFRIEFSVLSVQWTLVEMSKSLLPTFRDQSDVPLRDMEDNQSGDITWVAEYIFNNSDLDPGEEIRIRTEVSIVYYDSLNNENKKPIDYFELSFEGLVSGMYKDSVTRSIRPRLDIIKTGVFPNNKWYDENMIGVEITNKTSPTAYSISAHSFLRINAANRKQNIKKYLTDNGYELQISGTELSPSSPCSEEITSDDKEFHAYNYRVEIGGEQKTVSEMCEELISHNLNIPIEVGFKLKYEDSIGEEYSTEKVIKGIHIGDRLPDHVPDYCYINSTNQIKLADLM